MLLVTEDTFHVRTTKQQYSHLGFHDQVESEPRREERSNDVPVPRFPIGTEVVLWEGPEQSTFTSTTSPRSRRGQTSSKGYPKGQLVSSGRASDAYQRSDPGR